MINIIFDLIDFLKRLDWRVIAGMALTSVGVGLSVGMKAGFSFALIVVGLYFLFGEEKV